MTSQAQVLASEGAQVARSAGLGGLSAVETSRAVLAWAREAFGSRIVILSSMADEAMVHLASTVIPGVRVAFIDTGAHFPETLATREALALRLDIDVIDVRPTLSWERQDAEYGPRLFETNPDLCCKLRKIEPLNRALGGFDAWVTGMRRADAPTRAGVEAVEHDAGRDMVKINPLALWSDDDMDAYVREHEVFLNPLRQRGFVSIGCAPCTSLPEPGADPRSGRWAGTDKTECGLHK